MVLTGGKGDGHNRTVSSAKSSSMLSTQESETCWAGDETLKARMLDKQAVQPKKRIMPNTGFMQTRKLLS